MVKQRMTALDVRASVEEMRTQLRGLRLLNVYDISSKMFLFKFGHGENKKMLILESGVRLHLTELVREKPKIPSQFTLKLRKHVRAWRLDTVTQLQHDRTVDLCFGVPSAGEGASYHIIIELFSKGNVVLTDHEYRIMLLLRTHRDDDIKMFVRELYPVTKPFEEREEVAALQSRPKEEAPKQAGSNDDERVLALRSEWDAVFSRHADYETTRSTLSAVHHFGPALADHILAVTGVKNVKKGDLKCDGSEIFEKLLPGMLDAWDIALAALPTGGYLIQNVKQPGKRRDRKGVANSVDEKADTWTAPAACAVAAVGSAHVAEDSEKGDKPNTDAHKDLSVTATASTNLTTLPAVQYDDFSPVLLAQYRGDGVTTVYMSSFGKLCDTFFLHTETEKIDLHNEKKTTSVVGKKEKFERDHQRRIKALENEEDENRRKGELIIQNAEKVDEAIGLINGALASGIQWEALRGLLKRRHAEGHPVAYMVHDLFLERNSISVLVETERDDENEEEDCDVESCVIEVDLSCSAYANAAAYFSKKKANKAKLERTIASTAKAMAGAEKKGERLAAKQKTKKAIVKERRRFWWEKFAWFRTSCGDFVLQGKDMQTTEILVRRVMRLGDVFVHCDVDGALPCVLKPAGSAWADPAARVEENVQGEFPNPSPVSMHWTSLDEAGAWCVSRSSAWESKFSVAAWWVWGSQITGGTAAGCYLFDGEKHYLRPQPLSLGCGLLFLVTGRCVDTSDREELTNFTSADVETSFLPRDTAAALQPLPSVADLRGPRRQPRQPPPQQQQQQQQKQKQEQGSRQEHGKQPNLKQHEQEMDDIKKDASPPTGQPPLKPQQEQLTKHQRKKLRRIQEKYKDQDEEDRLRGAMLNGNQLAKVQCTILNKEKNEEKKERSSHVDPTTKTHPAKAQEKEEDEEEEEEESDDGDDHVDEDGNDEETKENDAEEENEEANDDQEGEEKVAGNTAATTSTKEGEEKASTAESKGSKETHPSRQARERQETSAADVARTAAVNDAELRREWCHFVSRPRAEDVVEFAVAVCAPMSAVVTYKYRTELSCGSAKKGQVATGLLEHFAAGTAGMENASEAHAVRSLEMFDLVEQLRGNLKRINARKAK